ncbi:MAG: AAA family ATPase [Bacteroidota bacterium]
MKEIKYRVFSILPFKVNLLILDSPRLMLEKITLENYRCYDYHSIEFKNLSIVVGKNNAGKSTLVEALRFVSLAVSRLKTSHYNPAPKWLDLPARARGVTPALKSFGFNTENLFHNYGNPTS